MAKKSLPATGPNNENAFDSPQRFESMDKLHAQYRSIKSRMETKLKEWENYLKCYRRWPIRRKDGGVDVNYGQFKFKIDKSIGLFNSIILERPQWAWIQPMIHEYDGKPVTNEQRQKWAKAISKSWHRWFIQTWQERIDNTNDDCLDMQLFLAGIEHWCNKGDVYPENIPVETVFPDLTAGRDPKKWETLFIYKRFTYVDLKKMMDDQADGVDATAINDLLTKNSNKVDNLTDFEKLRLDTESSIQSSNSILCVYAYVKEYDGTITRYLFPESGEYIPSDQKKNTEPEKRFLIRNEKYCDNMSQVVAIRTYHRFKNYWSGESLSDNIYHQCLTYDRTTNRAMRAGLRRATTWISADTPDLADRLRANPESEVEILESGAELKVQSVGSDIADLIQASRSLQFDTERYTSEALETGFQNTKGRAITASENQANLMRESQAQESKSDLFIAQDRRLVAEIYRRSLSVATGEAEGMYLKAFKAEMEAEGIPEDAYKFENVLIESTFAIFGGNFIAQMSAIERLLSFIRIRPSTEGEFEAQRDAVGAIVGYDRADLYLPYKEQTDNAESQHAGVENEILDNEDLDPRNVQVLATDNHMVHINMHIVDLEGCLGRINELINVYPQTPPPLKPVALSTIMRKQSTLGNRIGHIIAHVEFLNQDSGYEQVIPQINKKLREYTGIQQALSAKTEALLNEMLQGAQDQNYMTQSQALKLQDQQRQLEFAKEMDAIKSTSALGKAQFGMAKAQANAEVKAEEHNQQMQFNQDKFNLEIEAMIKKAAAEGAAQAIAAVNKSKQQ